VTEESEKYLIDSNIIIYHLNGDNIATEFLRSNISYSYISRVTFIEVISFDFTEGEKEKVFNLLRMFKIIDTTDAHRLTLKNCTQVVELGNRGIEHIGSYQEFHSRQEWLR